jgi:hypothetical protein
LGVLGFTLSLRNIPGIENRNVCSFSIGWELFERRRLNVIGRYCIIALTGIYRNISRSSVSEFCKGDFRGPGVIVEIKLTRDHYHG